MKVARVFTCCIRSNRFISEWRVGVRLMALALLTRMSMPPKARTVSATAACTWSSKRTSQTQPMARPPAASISATVAGTVPGRRGLGSAVLPSTAMLAPSRAARRAMALPMPRLAPVMNRVFPLRVLMISGWQVWWGRPQFRRRRADSRQSTVDSRRALRSRAGPTRTVDGRLWTVDFSLDLVGNREAARHGQHLDPGLLRFGLVAALRHREVQGDDAGQQGGAGQTVGDT